jgi:hypothetical protein
LEVLAVMNSGVEFDAWARYDRASELAEMVYKEWVEAGRPILLTHPNGMQGAHPLLKVMLDAETHAFRMSKPLSKRRPGRPPVAVIEPGGEPGRGVDLPPLELIQKQVREFRRSE